MGSLLVIKDWQFGLKGYIMPHCMTYALRCTVGMYLRSHSRAAPVTPDRFRSACFR
jgi:hypothetical protein